MEDTTNPTKRAPRPRAGPPRNLPTLYDSVDLGEVEGRQRAVAEVEPPTTSAETPADLAPPPPPHKTGPRPRLMRMKEKGLFNNG